MTPKESDKRRRRGATVEKTAQVVTAGAVAAATGAGAVGVGGAVLPSLVGWAAGALGWARMWVVDRRVRRWLEQLATSMDNESPEAVQQQIERNLDKAWMRDGLLESFRHLMGALDEEVIPALARLAAEYLGRGQVPDTFFRSAGTLLMELELADLESLSELVSLLLAQPGSADCINVEISRFSRNDQPLLKVSYRQVGSSPLEMELEMNHHERLVRLFGLLKRFDLGHDNPAGFYSVDSGPHVLILNGPVLKRLAALVPEPHEGANTPIETEAKSTGGSSA